MINELAMNEEFWSRKNMISSTGDYRNEMEQQARGLNNNLSNIQRSIETQTFALVASQAALANTMNQGFNQINNTLEMGFYGISSQLNYMTASLGMGLANIGNAVNIMSAQICSKLDALHDIMNNPLLTQSREKYRIAATRSKDGFFEEALESVKEALELNKTDYISWYLQGMIYLYGASKNRNVIDLDLAIEALTKAEEYNEPDSRRSDDAKRMRSEILYNLGFARLSKSNDLLRENRKAESDEMLVKARNSFAQSYQCSNNMLLSLFELARCKVFQGEYDSAINDLETLVLKDRNYCLKVYANPDFSNIKEQFNNLIKKLKKAVFIPLKNDYDRLSSLITELNSLGGCTAVTISSTFTEELPYFDILDYPNDFFKKNIPVVEKEIADRKTFLAQQAAQQIADKETSKKEEYDKAIMELRHINQTCSNNYKKLATAYKLLADELKSSENRDVVSLSEKMEDKIAVCNDLAGKVPISRFINYLIMAAYFYTLFGTDIIRSTSPWALTGNFPWSSVSLLIIFFISGLVVGIANLFFKGAGADGWIGWQSLMILVSAITVWSWGDIGFFASLGTFFVNIIVMAIVAIPGLIIAFVKSVEGRLKV